MKTWPLSLLLILTTPIFGQSEKRESSDHLEYAWLNKRIPLDSLVSYNGDTTVLFQSDTQYVISFWYSNCPPCIAEIEWLNLLKSNFSKENIRFIAISFDEKDKIEQFLKSHHFDFDLYHLDQDIINKNRLSLGYPTHLIVDEKGIVKFQRSGGSSNPTEAKRIYDLLATELKKRIH